MMSWICERAKRNQTTRKIQIEIHDPDKQADVITNIEPDILECDVTWALGNITTNKASGCDGIPVLDTLFQCGQLLFKWEPIITETIIQ